MNAGLATLAAAVKKAICSKFRTWLSKLRHATLVDLADCKEQERMQLGMVGLGKMGANMTRRLMRGGHQLVVSDLSAGCGEEDWQAKARAGRRRWRIWLAS